MSGRPKIAKVTAVVAMTVVAGGLITFIPVGGNAPSARPSDIAEVAGDPERGAYVIRLAGCITCHTDSKNSGAFLAGGRVFEVPFGTFISPNITPHEHNGIGDWSVDDIMFALETGLKPDGDAMGASMGEVVQDSTSYLSEEDLEAIAEYLRSLEPVAETIVRDDG